MTEFDGGRSIRYYAQVAAASVSTRLEICRDKLHDVLDDHGEHLCNVLFPLFQELVGGIDKDLRHLLSYMPYYEGDGNIFEVLVPTDDVKQLQLQVSIAKQCIQDTRLELDRKSDRLRLVQGRLDRRAQTIIYIRSTLYREVCALREDLKQKGLCAKENPDVGVFSLFDFLRILDEDPDKDDAESGNEFQQQLEKLLFRWKSEEAQRLELQSKYDEKKTEAELLQDKCAQLETGMKELSSRFSEEFVKLRTEKSVLQATTARAGKESEAAAEKCAELLSSLEGATKQLREIQQKQADTEAIVDRLESANVEIALDARTQLAAEKSKFAVELRKVEKWRNEESTPTTASPVPERDLPALQLIGQLHEAGLLEEDPRYIVEMRRLHKDLQASKSDLSDWQTECEKMTMQRDALENEVIELEQMLKELRTKEGSLGVKAGQQLESFAMAAKLRETKTDYSLLARKAVIFLEKYDIILTNSDAEELSESRAISSMASSIIDPTEARQRLYERPGTLNVQSLLERLEALDKRLRQRLTRDRLELKTNRRLVQSQEDQWTAE
ncbi:hypothetical protein DIPPA_55223, partial [Diplonema papillatum]